MKKDANETYMAVLRALGEAIEKNKNDLVFAQYEVDRLQKKLDEAQQQIEQLKRNKE